MKVFVKGRGTEVDLTQNDFVGQGGEGSIYTKNKIAYKIYHDHKHMIPIGKITELSTIQDPFVVKPKDVLVDKKGTSIGYTTDFIKNAWTLCQLFPIVFRRREGLTEKITKELVEKLREHISNVHKAKILIVDLNEMNFLVTKKFDEIYCIDVDSYETPHYKAPAIMDSIRDWSAKEWTELSDWYSFAIISFQMFIGLHPFNGRYLGRKHEFKAKISTDYIDDAFAVTRRRMLFNISVFHKDVGIPGAVLPFSVIPKTYMSWYEDLFVHGKRSLPPTTFIQAVFVPTMIPIKKISGTDMFDIEEIREYEGNVIDIFYNGQTVALTDIGVWIDKVRTDSPISKYCAFTPKANRTIVGTIINNKLSLYNASDRCPIHFELEVDEVSSYDGRIYAKSYDKVVEVVTTDAGSRVIASTNEVVNVVPHATHLYSGVVIQKLLGTTYVSLLSKSSFAQQIKIKELDDYRIIDAKYDNNVLMAIGERKGKYSRLIFRFDERGNYDVRIVANITNYSINFVTLDTNVCVCINEEEKIEIFSTKKDSQAMKTIEDDVISSVMRLVKQAGTLFFVKDSKLFKIRMK